MLHEFLNNVMHNLFKPLLLFFYLGFLIPIFRVKFEFPKPLYQALTIYLLVAIGWHGGEELAALPSNMYAQAGGLMVIGFFTNTVIGVIAFMLLRSLTKLRAIDAATVAGYYGSDSAGTFVTCVGVLVAANIAYAPYMPVLLAVMEVPGCLVALYIVSRLRQNGMDRAGNMPGEQSYMGANGGALALATNGGLDEDTHVTTHDSDAELVGATAGHGEYRSSGGGHSTTKGGGHQGGHHRRSSHGGPDSDEGGNEELTRAEVHRAEAEEAKLALINSKGGIHPVSKASRKSPFSKELLHEVFFNPGIFLLFGGIAIGFIARLQGTKVTDADDPFFVNMFQGVLCLFLLEMGITASSKLRDLRSAGPAFIAFGLLAPNLFACIGMTVLHIYSICLGQPFTIGSYVLFAVLCGASSYIAVPAVQRMAIPEASPTLPLAASLGLTFSYNVTLGIPVYLMIATAITQHFPVVAAVAAVVK